MYATGMPLNNILEFSKIYYSTPLRLLVGSAFSSSFVKLTAFLFMAVFLPHKELDHFFLLLKKCPYASNKLCNLYKPQDDDGDRQAVAVLLHVESPHFLREKISSEMDVWTDRQEYILHYTS